jgi:galactoside O-acetyltransferase
MLSRLIGRLASACVRLAADHDAARLLARCPRTGEGHVRLRMPVVIYAPERLQLGHTIDIGEFTHIRANGGVRIGDRVLIAAGVTITSRAHPVPLPRARVNEDRPIVIEDDVWLGAGAIVLPGVTIGRGAVVAAGAVVTKSVEPFTVVAGVPARPIRKIPEGEKK